MPTTVTLTGWKEFEAKLKNMPKTLEREFNGEVEESARHWGRLAKNDAPIDVGFLRGQITSKKVSSMNYEVTSGANYSPYIEWGTKGRARIPAGLEGYASQFRGKGVGDYYDFLNAILDWVKRKGLHNVRNSYTGKNVGGKAAKENLVVLAESIAFSIIRHGIHPHPFFFPQVPAVNKKLIFDIQAILNRPH